MAIYTIIMVILIKLSHHQLGMRKDSSKVLSDKILEVLRQSRKRYGLHYLTIRTMTKSDTKTVESLPKSWQKNFLQQLRLMEQQGDVISAGTRNLYFKIAPITRRQRSVIPSPPDSITEQLSYEMSQDDRREDGTLTEESDNLQSMEKMDKVQRESKRVAEENQRLCQLVEAIATNNQQKIVSIEKSKGACQRLSRLVNREISKKVCLLQQKEAVHKMTDMAKVFNANMKLEGEQRLLRTMASIDELYSEEERKLLDDERTEMENLKLQQRADNENRMEQLQQADGEMQQVMSQINKLKGMISKLRTVVTELNRL